jgi:XTP/dITP diphosphohydrolase
MDILVGTRNPGKLNEIKRLLGPMGFNIHTPDEFGITSDFEETGETFEENALGKARFFYNHLEEKMPTLADDSGLFVEALKDELGVKTRRWGSGADASDEVWLAYFMDKMADKVDRSGKFVCAIAYVTEEVEELFVGENPGDIVVQQETDIVPGIPLSSVFKPVGYDKVYSALPDDEKNRISHRGRALHKLLNYLQNV